MINKLLAIFIFALSFQVLAAPTTPPIKKMKWGNMDIVYLEDKRFPTYDIIIYFADGTLSDYPSRVGETSFMFNELSSGTNRYGQKEISDNLEYYGVSISSRVTHEYSTIKVGGLVKDIIPTFKKLCHLADDAIFPEKELQKNKKQIISSLQNIITDHGDLADRVFRELSLKNSPFGGPTGGKIKSIKQIKSSHLRSKKDYFNKKVRKRIYLTGPADVLRIKDIILSECQWGNESEKFVRTAEQIHPKFIATNPKIYLIPVPKANQAQIRIGRILSSSEKLDHDQLTLAAAFLGGGFTSKLMHETRTKRGLTYSVGAFAGLQNQYGRAGISTFTKNQTLVEILNVIKNTLDSTGEVVVTEELARSVGMLTGSHLFKFERTSALLSNLMFLDHVGESYESLFNFPGKVSSYTPQQAASVIKKLYDWQNLTLVVVGNKDLQKKLSELGKVKVMDYKSFL